MEVRKVIFVPTSRVHNLTVNTVNLIRMCQDMHTLPKSGGLYDQDVLFIYVLKYYLEWQSQRAELDGRKANVQSSIG